MIQLNRFLIMGLDKCKLHIVNGLNDANLKCKVTKAKQADKQNN